MMVLKLLLVVLATLTFTDACGNDLKVLPPGLRCFFSPSGTYLLEVRSTDQGRQPQSQAGLFLISAEGRRNLWFAELPHRYGPGFVFVSDSGEVLLVDEWIKTPSPYALTLYAKTGAVVARYSMMDIVTVSGISSPELVTRARVGPWMSAPPKLPPTRESVMLEAGGVDLEISFSSGRLSKKKGNGDR